REQRQPTGDEQAVLARFCSWGALAQAVFARPEYEWARDELAGLLTDEEIAAARAATLNAHFTDAALVQQVWRAVTELGFDGGQVLEPGCGTGNFIGFAPPQAQIVGVELDPVTAEIAGWLYPQATVRVESFAKTRMVHGAFDATVGNVPFGKYVEHDPVYNPERFTIHNAFLFKAVQMTRPGGLVAVFTSRYTMDATDTPVRDRLYAFADLVGAVRLPSGAHRKAAGTDVVTDLLILRRREPGRTPAADTWLHTTPVEVDGHRIPINQFFVDHPELVLGELTAGSGPYGEAELSVDGPADASLLLAEAVNRIVTGARARQLTWTPVAADQAASVAFLDPHATVPDRYLRAHRDGSFTQVVYGTEQPFDVPDGQAAELRALLGLRDTVVELLDAEANTEQATAHIDTLRRRLNQLYDAYHSRYGPISRTTATRTGALRRPSQGGFRKDPYAVLVQALEIYDPDTRAATKAEIFHQRVEQPRRAATRADTPADALAICMDRHAALRLPVIAELLGTDERATRQALGTLVFDDPDTGALVLADEYLSGNVRAKHAQAVKAAATDPRYGPNATALAEVIPTDIPPQEIRAQLGASWIEADHVQQFLRETLDDPDLKVDHPGGSTWKVLSWRHSLEAAEQWGSPDAPAPALAEALLCRKPIEVRRSTADGGTYLDTEATAVAAAKASELDERFGEWLWEDPARAAELARKYNHEFNATRLRTYAGSYLTFPGLAHGFSPRGHQNAGVERVLLNPAVGLFHEVGAGKTSVMIIAAMEMRRLGLVTKPVIVTPKNVLQPFVAEFLERYPRARLLVGYAEDITPDQRRAFIARAATTSWDAVLMTRDAFERIPMDHASRLAYLSRAVEEVTATTSLAEDADWDEATVKELQRAKKRAEERVERLMDKAHDDGIDFKQTLIDYVFADEAAANQGYKNLMTVSSMPGMSITPGSGRALDLHMKLEHLRVHYPRVATLATATPITRSLAEVYNWMRYLDPQALRERAITTFDQFLATFTTATTDFELTVTGALKLKTRVNRIVNIPELIGMFAAVGDIKTAEDLQLPTPLLKQRPDGKRRPQILTIAQGPHAHDYQEHLERRADAIGGRPEKGGDNHLRIVSDGKAAAVDLRLVGRTADQPSKLTTVADNITRIWQETKDNEYLTRTGQPSPHQGALQIVFCDLGVPSERRNKSSTFVVYHELRDQLTARGIPREKIRYAHEAGNDERKRAALVDECNYGKIAVLIASTSKAGQGTNMQARAIALHHVDCTWNPSDLMQREGRITRQGNQNPEIYILN
ncbi:MAG: helicase-related protein, partial [Natronosporangium sp.]